MTLDLNTVHVGDCRSFLAQMDDDSVNCIVTSPHYWGLRDYGLPASIWGGDPACVHDWDEGETRAQTGGGSNKGNAGSFVSSGACGAWRGSLGLEPSPTMFVEHVVEVFRAARRVLRPDGVLWLNLGDCYATGAGKVGDHPGGGDQGARWAGDGRGYRGERLANGRGDQPAIYRVKTRATRDGTHAGKHTAMAAMGPMTQPNRLPIEGLKPKDLVGIPWRVAFALQADGWWLRSDVIWSKPNPMPESVMDRPTKSHEYLFLLTKSEIYAYDADAIKEPVQYGDHPRNGVASHLTQAPGQPVQNGITNRRRSGNKERKYRKDNGGVADRPTNQGTGVPWTDKDGTRNKRSVWTIPTEPFPKSHFATFPRRLVEPCIKSGCPIGGTVLDPFGGSGTVGQVAADLGRNWILLELNPEYAEMARVRVATRTPMAQLEIGGAA